MKFDQWWSSNKKRREETLPFEREAAMEAWEACKKQVLEILDNYRHAPAYPYIKEKMKAL